MKYSESNITSEYTKSGVQKAGKCLLIDGLISKDPNKYRECMDTLSRWRACHIETLNEVSSKLTIVASQIDQNAIVVSRLKRTPSIITKLKRNPKMNLDRMQDIAGCRAIVKTPKLVSKVRRRLKLAFQLKETNYIDNPKEDGYRGVHLIGKHLSEIDNKYYQVEIQVRTKLQHAWATAVEIVDLFTNQTLKSNIGKKEWKEFFKYSADEFAGLEETPKRHKNSQSRLSESISKLSIYQKFDAFRITLNFIDQNVSIQQHAYCLIKIHTKTNTGEVSLFSEAKAKEATAQYLAAEKESAKNPTIVSALVSVASVDNLKDAFPNYFADSSLFIETLRSVDGYQSSTLTSYISNWLKKSGL